MKKAKTLFEFLMACSFLVGCGGPDVPPDPPVPPTPVIDDGGIDLTYMRMNATYGSQVKFNYTYTSETDDIKVYWGDGTVNNSNYHKYSNPGRYHIYITGHINNIALSDETGRKYAVDNNWITDVIFSNHMTSIPTNAFNVGGTHFQSALIPKTVKTIGSKAFVKNSAKIYCFVDKRGDGWQSDCFADIAASNIMSGLNLYLQDDKILYAAYNKDNEKFATVYTCCDLALKDAIIKDKIIVNNDEYPVTSIWESAFYGMDTLVSLDVPGSVEQIGKFAFVDCKNLKTIKLSKGLKEIGAEAFKNVGITSIVFPSSIKTLDNNSFDDCSKLQSVTFEDNPQFKELESGIFDGCSNINYLKLGEGLVSLESYSIQGFAIRELRLPSTVEFLIGYTFSNCGSLETIDATAFKDINSIPTSEKDKVFSFANRNNTITIRIDSSLSEGDFTNKGWPGTRPAEHDVTGIAYLSVNQ